ncbi:voltage-dependent T-type calcium channel subunit alpha-1H isoform X3 [Paramormyrops kingsleyae]|uniref:voltage-dependent T-type calcium channel subunit alpha-1H isoform X3 n=1 Tax=Paramormyrops kingsleyae TaxID=1676925 RepID=UPI000CD664ED|nr:voltage-dependent T-type calcium channel subunit alpha-1H isoform X1 [Paramormyrops kingsleyae]
MTDGEGREHFHFLENEEVRVPISGQCGNLRDERDGGSVPNPALENATYREPGGRGPAPDLVSEDEEEAPYPAMAPVVFFCLKQTTRPRSWCLKLVCNPWFEHVSMLVILLNCVTLGMFQPCEDVKCQSDWCTILQAFDDFIFAFFAVEMVIKMLALGIFGQKCYLGDTWNRLDFFIVMAGMLEYSLDGHNISLSAIRTVRVLRPLRAINRVPSMRILVTLLLDTLPMLGNVLLLCFFVFFIFGIVGVQLWAGLLRNRCFLEDDWKMMHNFSFLSSYYKHEDAEDLPFICSSHRDNGMLHCHDLPPLKEAGQQCQLGADFASPTHGALEGASKNGCINWNQYYNVCRAGEVNPHKGAINFDNIGYAWIAIFQVITLEGWVDIMYYVMDAHSFYNFIYFIFLIIVGSFFMINLCLVVIATQFSETKQRENQLMQEQRERFLSNDSTLASFSEPGSCYEEMLKYISHLYRKVKRRVSRAYRSWESKRRKKVDPSSGGAGRGPAGGANGCGRRQSDERRMRCIQHLVHHHHHHHHHYHMSNGGPAGGPEIGDMLEMKALRPPPQLALPSPMQCPSPGAESVRSVYHTDCHHQRARLQQPPTGMIGNLQLLSELNGGMNYPTIMPSICSRPSATTRAKKVSDHALTLSKASAHLNIPDPYGKLSQLVGDHAGMCQARSCLSGLNLPFQTSGGMPAHLSCELMSCPRCARILENPDLDLSDSDSAGSDGEVVYEFTRDGRHGHESKPGQHHRSPRKHRQKNCLLRRCDHFQEKLKRIVESKYFNRGIMIAILINTLSMGIEYHEQPDELTDVLEISNIVFTSMFALEMLLKLLAFGLFGYIRNPYNIFDGIIVVISVWEIIGQSDGGLSVLRTFRLLRVLKLVRFLPALRRQLVVLMKTMDNVATFCMLLMLFIFIFSILGMHLFGCKFSLKMENGDTIPDRKNFDSLLWAIVTVFQILTQEDWNMVLYNGMASTSPWAALYFVALMTFGNYVLFNLLVAILVEGFQAEGDANRSEMEDDKMSVHLEEEEKLRTAELKIHSLMVTQNGHLDPRASMPPPVIMRTAATPMPTPRPYADPIHAFCESRRGSSCSIEPGAADLKSPSSHRSSPCPPWGATSNWGSRRSSWASLGRGPSLKRRDPSGERESLLSGEGHGSLEDDDSDGGGSSRTGSVSGGSPRPRADSLDLPELLQVSVARHTADHHDCNGKSLRSAPDFLCPALGRDEPDYEDDADVEESLCYRIKKMLDPYKPQWCRDHEDWALYLFSPQNEFRITCQKVIAHKMFDHVVLVFIFLNCITIALERPDILPSSTERVFLSVSNYIFTAIFVAEMTVKVVALGFYVGNNCYLQSSWNVLDGMLVFVSIVDIVVSLASAGGNRILGILRVLRLLRTLRPLRVISRAPGLKLVVETLITSLRPIGNIVLICCAFFIVFGILGVQLFKGKFYHCEGFDTRNITNKSDCLLANFRWIRRKYNFDNLGQALMSLFVLSSKDGWVNIMYDGLDAVGVDQQPVRNHNPWMLLYFISFLLIVSFFVLNMFVGVVVENFHKCRQHQEAEEARLREEKRMKRMEKRRRKAQQRPYFADYSPARLYIHTLCTNHYLDLFITCIICINVVTMSMEHYNQPKYLEEVLKYCNYVFTIVFVLEALLKLVAFGFRRFFKERWNQLDLAIVLLSIMGITLEEIEINASLPINPTIIRIMRVLRIARVLKLLKMATGMRALLDTVVQALPQVGNLGLLFMLLFFIYAALGVELFGKLECNEDNPCEGLSRHATFENFGMAFLTLFRVSTGDNWNGIMKDTLRECRSEDKHCLSYLPLISPLYFVTFVLIAQFVLVNVVVAVLMKHLEESNKEAKEDAEMDAEIELEMTRQLSANAAAATLGPDSQDGYSGQHPDSPTQDEALQCAAENLLSVRKACVSRMHSLPNDSYMFRPVRPANAPFPLSEVESCDGSLHLGSVTSVSSQPSRGSSQLCVPGASPHASPTSLYDNSSLPRIPPPRLTSCSGASRPLRRQEAIKSDSIEVQSFDSRDNLERQSCESLQQMAPMLHSTSYSREGGSAAASPECSPPPASRTRAASVQTRWQVYGQHSSAGRPSSGPAEGAGPEDSTLELVDPADEEVRHINSSAAGWAGGPLDARSQSLSPYSSPSNEIPVPLKNFGSATDLQSASAREKDLKKFYSVDTEGFLTRPSWADDGRRHSIEICPSFDEGLFSESERRSSLQSQSGSSECLPIQRKKKMSPPCISVEPPVETELLAPAASRNTSSETSMLLRRRTPSFESSLQRDSLDLLEPQIIVEAPPKVERHLPIPRISFDQSDLSSMSSMSDILSDSDQSMHSFDARQEGGAHVRMEHLQVPGSRGMDNSRQTRGHTSRTPSSRKRGLVRMASTRDDDEPAA